MMSPVWKEQALFNYEDVQSVDDDVIENREDVECNELNYEQQQELEAALYSQIHYEPTSGEAPSHLDGVDFLVEDLIANISDADQLTVPVCKNDSVHQKKRPTSQLDNEPEADNVKSESGEQWISTLMGLTSGSADKKSPRLDQHENKSDISSSTSLQDFLMKKTLVSKKKKSDVCSIFISSEDESSASEMSTITETSSDSFDSDSDFVLDLDQEKVDDTIVFNKGIHLPSKDKATKQNISRYYIKPSVICRSCTKVGHMSRECPKKTPACLVCGVRGHLARNCQHKICFNCETTGHDKSECQQPRRSRYIKCNRCYLYGHKNQECNDLWRQYHLTTEDGPIMQGIGKVNRSAYCANCSGRGHFAEECRRHTYATASSQMVHKYPPDSVAATRKRSCEELPSAPPRKRARTDDKHPVSNESMQDILNAERRQNGKWESCREHQVSSKDFNRTQRDGRDRDSENQSGSSDPTRTKRGRQTESLKHSHSPNEITLSSTRSTSSGWLKSGESQTVHRTKRHCLSDSERQSSTNDIDFRTSAKSNKSGWLKSSDGERHPSASDIDYRTSANSTSSGQLKSSESQTAHRTKCVRQGNWLSDSERHPSGNDIDDRIPTRFSHKGRPQSSENQNFHRDQRARQSGWLMDSETIRRINAAADLISNFSYGGPHGDTPNVAQNNSDPNNHFKSEENVVRQKGKKKKRVENSRERQLKPKNRKLCTKDDRNTTLKSGKNTPYKGLQKKSAKGEHNVKKKKDLINETDFRIQVAGNDGDKFADAKVRKVSMVSGKKDRMRTKNKTKTNKRKVNKLAGSITDSWPNNTVISKADKGKKKKKQSWKSDRGFIAHQ